MQKAYLILENGKTFVGESFGACGTSSGELVFTTGMTGLAESLTDPCYFGQIVIYTFPEIGNYGIAYEDCESDKCNFAGVVARNYTKMPSNFRCEISVDEYLKQQNIIGICGIDTRELTQILRDNGTMKAVITTEEPTDKYFELALGNAVESVSCKEAYTVKAENESYNVALLNYGVKKSTVKKLTDLGCTVTVLPYDTPAEEILNGGYDGIVLSEGPGDPADNETAVSEIKKLLGKLPVMGRGLGHQMLAMAAGGKTVKLKFGHRGANQPVKDLATGKVLVTSQNHGYAVDGNTLGRTGAKVEFVNVNDGSIEGMSYPALKAVSVQFEHDAVYARFTAMMGGK